MDDTKKTADDANSDGAGLGTDGTIPASDDGIAVGIGEDSTFEPEEDEHADTDGEGR